MGYSLYRKPPYQRPLFSGSCEGPSLRTLSEGSALWRCTSSASRAWRSGLEVLKKKLQSWYPQDIPSGCYPPMVDIPRWNILGISTIGFIGNSPDWTWFQITPTWNEAQRSTHGTVRWWSNIGAWLFHPADFCFFGHGKLVDGFKYNVYSYYIYNWI